MMSANTVGGGYFESETYSKQFEGHHDLSIRPDGIASEVPERSVTYTYC